MIRTILFLLISGLILAGVVVSANYHFSIKQAYERVGSKGIVISSPYGDIEYTEGGSGPDVLVIHGSGGGHDQGELIVQTVLGDRFHWITPSRFGYLRSTFHEGATFDDQAHAYAYLLDSLGIDQVAVVALSHGGPSALLFAALHPERVSSLTLISCGVAPSTSEDQSEADAKGAMLTTIYKYDALYWAVTKLFNKQFMDLLGASDEVTAHLTDEQREFVDHFIDYMNPVSLRSAGVNFDNQAVLPGERIEAITAPTLILHAKDDTLQLYHNAEFAASHIQNSRLVTFESGGHVVMIVEQTAIREAVQQHILDQVSDFGR